MCTQYILHSPFTQLYNVCTFVNVDMLIDLFTYIVPNTLHPEAGVTVSEVTYLYALDGKMTYIHHDYIKITHDQKDLPLSKPHKRNLVCIFILITLPLLMSIVSRSYVQCPCSCLFISFSLISLKDTSFPTQGIEPIFSPLSYNK